MQVPYIKAIAEAIVDNDGKLIVLKGSYAREFWLGKRNGNQKAKDLRKTLQDEKILEDIGSENILRFARDFKFGNVTVAA